MLAVSLTPPELRLDLETTPPLPLYKRGQVDQRRFMVIEIEHTYSSG